MEKRGQAYLVSAIILVAIILSIVAVANYSEKNESEDIISLKEELKIESAKVLDYGINNSLSQPQMNQNLIDFTQIYLDTESRDKDIYFVFGDQSNITLKGYQNSAHSVSLDDVSVASSSGEFLGSVDPSGSSVTLNIDSNAYVFSLSNGENFYFIISREIGGNNYVVAG